MEKIFVTAIQAKRNATTAYLTHEEGIVVDALRMVEGMRPAVARTRQYLEETMTVYPNDRLLSDESQGLLIDMAAVSAKTAVDRTGLFAVDGTPATPHMHYGTAQLFAGAVMGISYDTLERPLTILTNTVTKERNDAAPLSSFAEVIAWAKSLDLDGMNQSWPTTFLEYVEREYAMTQGRPFTLIDGPICTQNLLTQELGRALLLQFFTTLPLVCGVVKSLQASTMIHRLFARALHPGEALLIEPSKELVERRSGNQDTNGHVRHFRWLQQFFDGLESHGIDLWRGVYRPGAKAFGFECDRRHLDTVIAMLWQERDVHHIGHEIPFLLNQVDANLRSTYNARSYKNHLIYALGLDLGDDELFDELDERDLR